MKMVAEWMVVLTLAGGVLAASAGTVSAERIARRDAAMQKARAVAAERKAARAAKQAAAEEKAAEAKAARMERKAELEAKRAEASATAEKRVDARQEHQAQRIQHGIQKGYLTADEISTLQNQQTRIAGLEGTCKSDGLLTRTEVKDIQAALNTASRCIWAEKHDTEGNQMPVYRLGMNIRAKDNLTQALANENLDKVQARTLLKDFHRTVELKRILATENLSDAQRANLQAEYDGLLNLYFEVADGK